MENNCLDKGATVFALDIGTRSIIGLLGSVEKEEIIIHHVAIEYHKKRVMFDGQIHDIEGVVEVVNKVKEELEQKAGFQLEEVAIAAAGRSLRTHRVKIEKEIDINSEIDKILLRSIEIEGLQIAQSQLEEVLQEETKYFCVGHTVVNYYLNDILITNPIGHRGKKLSIDIIATFLPQIVVDSLRTVMLKVGLDISYMTLEPIASIEVAVPENIRLLNIALVDIGAGTSDIAITKDGAVIAYAMTSTAGDEITETLAKRYLLDFDSAEKLKCNLCKKGIQYFTDILGMQQEGKTEDIIGEIDSSIELIAKDIADNILIQNGKAPSAIFLIGGGSQIPGLGEKISTHLNMPKERVAVRGVEIIKSLQINQMPLSGPEGITPVGILVKAVHNKEKDFVEIKVNEKSIKIFKSKKLKVSDALVLTGFNPRELIPKRGNNITIKLKDKKKVLYGEYGEPAQIAINGKNANIDTPIKAGDCITITPAQNGEDAKYYIKDIINTEESVNIDGKVTNRNYGITINGQVVKETELLKDGDEVNYYSIDSGKDLYDYFEVNAEFYYFTIDGKEIGINDFIPENAEIYINKKQIKEQNEIKKQIKEQIKEQNEIKKQIKEQVKEQNEIKKQIKEQVKEQNEIREKSMINLNHFNQTSQIKQTNQTNQISQIKQINQKIQSNRIQSNGNSMIIFYNGSPFEINDKRKNLMFVDIFNHIDFDRTKVQGKLVLKHNGKNANYTDPLREGDEVVIYWEK